MRISDWSSDVCSSDLGAELRDRHGEEILGVARIKPRHGNPSGLRQRHRRCGRDRRRDGEPALMPYLVPGLEDPERAGLVPAQRSEEHTSELQSLMRISYAVFCLKKTKHNTTKHTH